MLLIFLCYFLVAPASQHTTITLSTDTEMTLYHGTANDDFLSKGNSFDCSAYIYAYAQTDQQYQGNLPTLLQLKQLTSTVQVSITTIYDHFQPTLNQSSCGAGNCGIEIMSNCPNELNSDNYFDIMQLTVQDIGTFSYYLSCDQDFLPFYFEWGQLLITISATVTVTIAVIFARLESFNGSGIEYSVKIVLLVCLFVLGVGLLTLYVPEVAAPLLDVVSWIFGTIGVGLVTVEILFHFFSHSWLIKGCTIGIFPVRYMDIIGVLTGLGWLSAWWFSSRNWLISDWISICIIVSFIKIFKYTSLKVALFSYSILLCIYITGAVLSSIEHGQNTEIYFLFTVNNPAQFQIPTITPTYRANCVWISFTSMALPGLLMAYLHRFDKSRATNIYVISSLIAYFIGSFIWNILISFSRQDIPFDAVCPPFVLLTLVFMAFNRKELRVIWDGTFYDEEFFNKQDIDNLGQRLSLELPQVDLLRGSISKEMYLDKEGLSFFRENIDLNTKALLITADEPEP